MENQQRQVIENIARSFKSRRWLWGSLVATSLIGLAGIAVWAGRPRDDLLEPVCSPPVADAQQTGCVAALPIKDIDIDISSTIGLSRDGTKLLLAGALAHDKTKFVLQALDVAERREVWRVPVEGLGFYHKLAVSGKDDRVAVWGSEPTIRIVDMQNGKPIVDLSTRSPYVPLYHDVFFSKDDAAIVVGFPSRRRLLSLSDPTAEPAMLPEFGKAESCQGLGFVGQSNAGYLRSRDGSVAVLFSATRSTPLRAGEHLSTYQLSLYTCGTNSVVLLDAPTGWGSRAMLFSSFSQDNSKLAIVYADWELGRETRSLIEVWDMSGRDLDRLAAFPVHGDVGTRIAWSADGRKLAAIRSDRANKTEARIYLIP